jgi:hypothetical protein
VEPAEASISWIKIYTVNPVETRQCTETVDPVACTPASGWEKGLVENQVGLVRECFFTARLRVKTYDELNGWLTNKCVAYAKVCILIQNCIEL